MQVRGGVLGAAVVLLALSACGDTGPRSSAPTPSAPTPSAPTTSPSTASPAGSSPTGESTTGESTTGESTTGESTPSPEATEPLASDGSPHRALLDIPRLGIDDLPVVPYRGFTDDAKGTEIQDRGVAASPHGPSGGTGPGGVGNYQVTAHRLSSTQAFRYLPDLRRGDRVHVEAGDVRYTYRIATTRITSFRSEQSLREQRAAVPGRPGVEPDRAMITLSTCRTSEDHAEGNFWSDEFGNPEHRIDKIGVLVKTSPRQ